MASNVKLKDLGVIDCETRHQGGEWIVLYNDPDNPNAKKNVGQFVSFFGAGHGYKKSILALSALGADLRKRGYTGTLHNIKPVMAKRGGVPA
jgi:hypothetical protein